jgi:putative membrane protein
MNAAVGIASALGHGAGFYGAAPWFFFVIPALWFLLAVVVIVLIARRRARWAATGHPGWQNRMSWQASREAAGASLQAEATVAERFAKGEIDEVEYRAKLAVLRANRPAPGGDV